ncbi:hypothetical protein GCM10022415_28370 [Knoellia locipacati]|uniref:Peptidase MA-like domain-containing protein n=1 Tax=Knoellia locipacati TaxID=882824 RepID=A0A512T4C1_9MICO|nr:hypothetical protein [Knoellia locipacati]GEQ15075.1 hypothetical protein KLO01_31220 [Knoellia locipacati]
MPLTDPTTRMPWRPSRARRAVVVTLGVLALALTAGCDRDADTPAPRASVATPTAPESAQPAPTAPPTLAASPPAGAEPATPLPGARTVQGRASTVTGTVDEATLTAYAAMADRAVAEVSKRWKRPWPRRVTVIAPKDATAFREQVGRADDLSQVAAITDGPLGADGRATGDRILLNPDAFARLTPEGRQFVLTHESTHVAVRSSLPGAPPLWLVEGYADHVGYAASDRRRADLAAPLLERVRNGSGPTRLPTQGDLDPGQGEIAPSYLASWLAVDLIARRHGEARLEAFYEASSVASSPADADSAMDRAFADVLGTTRAAFTKAWLAELNQLAAPK